MLLSGLFSMGEELRRSLVNRMYESAGHKPHKKTGRPAVALADIQRRVYMTSRFFNSTDKFFHAKQTEFKQPRKLRQYSSRRWQETASDCTGKITGLRVKPLQFEAGLGLLNDLEHGDRFHLYHSSLAREIWRPKQLM